MYVVYVQIMSHKRQLNTEQGVIDDTQAQKPTKHCVLTHIIH